MKKLLLIILLLSLAKFASADFWGLNVPPKDLPQVNAEEVHPTTGNIYIFND